MSNSNEEKDLARCGRRTGRKVFPAKKIIGVEDDGTEIWGEYSTDSENSVDGSENTQVTQPSPLTNISSQTGRRPPVLSLVDTQNRLGRRTGERVLAGKQIRLLKDGTENYHDYWTDQSSSINDTSRSSTLSGSTDSSNYREKSSFAQARDQMDSYKQKKIMVDKCCNTSWSFKDDIKSTYGNESGASKINRDSTNPETPRKKIRIFEREINGVGIVDADPLPSNPTHVEPVTTPRRRLPPKTPPRKKLYSANSSKMNLVEYPEKNLEFWEQELEAEPVINVPRGDESKRKKAKRRSIVDKIMKKSEKIISTRCGKTTKDRQETSKIDKNFSENSEENCENLACLELDINCEPEITASKGKKILKPKIPPNELRRSIRERIAPLKHWENERRLFAHDLRTGEIKNLGIVCGTGVVDACQKYVDRSEAVDLDKKLTHQIHQASLKNNRRKTL